MLIRECSKKVYQGVQGVQGVPRPGKVCPRSSSTNETKRTPQLIHLLHGKDDGAVFLLPLFNPLTGLVTDTPNTPLYTLYTFKINK